MVPALKAILLGVVQGLTEFVPISSSGHLVLLPRLFGWSDPGLAFDVAAHLGTLLAVLVYFRREWLAVVRGFFSSFRVRPSRWDFNHRLAWLLVLATVPAAVAGALLENVVEDHLRAVGPVGLFLAIGALAMLVAELLGRKQRDFQSVKTGDALSMGLAQVLALAPGMSRCGITISAGMVRGLDREGAARFSFMMAAPIIGGAGLLEICKIATEGLGECGAGMLVAGFAASAVVGFFTIKYFLRYLQKHSLYPFIAYGAALALAILVVVVLT